MPLVLSLFPGIGLLDRAFEEVGCCVVRGPDLIWGGDIHRFHPPAGRFDLVIGGPPCQRFSGLANINRVRWGEESLAPNLIPEFERVVAEAQPQAFLMENVEAAPLPSVPGYEVHGQVLNNRWVGGEQNRERRFSFGTKDGGRLHVAQEALDPVVWSPAVTSSAGGRRKTPKRMPSGGLHPMGETSRPLEEMLRLQDLPEDFLSHAPFTTQGKKQAVANGVPLPMGLAVAKAVMCAMGWDATSSRLVR